MNIDAPEFVFDSTKVPKEGKKKKAKNPEQADSAQEPSTAAKKPRSRKKAGAVVP